MDCPGTRPESCVAEANGMNPTIPDGLGKLIRLLPTKMWWYVSCRGAPGSTFQLAFGAKVRRPVPLKNPAHSEEYRLFEGELNLLVWCVWRLDSSDCCLTSWDDRKSSIESELGKLVGARVASVELAEPCWDMHLLFSNSLSLRIFCDHVPGDPSFDGNWDLSCPAYIVSVGPGTKISIEDRTISY
jgi:hypothetical protein